MIHEKADNSMTRVTFTDFLFSIICAGRSGIRFDWIRRLEIALGVARGLHYLHDFIDPPIIHGDIKTNNILLNEQLVAKVADYGLFKSFTDITTNRTHEPIQLKGTLVSNTSSIILRRTSEFRCCILAFRSKSQQMLLTIFYNVIDANTVSISMLCIRIHIHVSL